MTSVPRAVVSKAELLRQLEEVEPGKSSREISEQSTCFVFKNGKVVAFNEEIFCCTTTELPKEGVGAVKADPLLKLLRARPEESVEVQFHPTQLVIASKGKKSWVRLEEKILLPLNAVPAPTAWHKINEDFTDAVGIVESCAGKDESAFKYTCVHITPEYMESCDNFQISRYNLNTGIEGQILVRADGIRHILKYDVTDMAQSDQWLHFRRGNEYWISLKINRDSYDNLDQYLAVTGFPIVLPKTLAEAAETAEIFTAEVPDEARNQVRVQGRQGILKIEGVGDSGGHEELKRIIYKGPPFDFKVAPRLLAELVKRHTRCDINPTEHRLKVNGGKFVYLACLEKGETSGQEVKETGDATEET